MWKSEKQTAEGRRQTAGSSFLRSLSAGFESRSVSCLLTGEQTADGRRQTAGNSFLRSLSAGFESRSVSCLLLSAVCLLTFACRRDMQDQPKMKPYRQTTFFTDGLSSRPPVEGTIARGFLKTDTEFFTGKKAGRGTASAVNPQRPQGPNTPSASGAAAYPDDVELFPLTVTKEIVTRGKERYEIFCSACHGLTGNGDGMIVRRGFRRAASFNDDRLRQAPVGHFFDAITNGWGAMPSYATQIPAEDRWAIIAYIRALQLSQQKTEAPAPPTSPTQSPAIQSGGPEH